MNFIFSTFSCPLVRLKYIIPVFELINGYIFRKKRKIETPKINYIWISFFFFFKISVTTNFIFYKSQMFPLFYFRNNYFWPDFFGSIITK